MIDLSPDEQLRRVLEAEDGMPVSAGARMIHVLAAIESGRAVCVDLSGVPADKRPGLMAEIRDLVHQAGGGPVVPDASGPAS
jgi:hypothetical protein